MILASPPAGRPDRLWLRLAVPPGWLEARLAAWIMALCDTDPDRLELAGVHLPDARRYTEAAALFEENDLDFVEICTLPDTHRELVELAAQTRRAHALPEAGGAGPAGTEGDDRSL